MPQKSNLAAGADASLHTIIAALRFWQSQGMCNADNRNEEFHDLATCAGEVEPLTEEEIDDLVIELNVSPLPFMTDQKSADGAE